MQKRNKVRRTGLTLERLEARTLLAGVTLGPGEMYCPRTSGVYAATGGGFIDEGGNGDVRGVCVYNEGPGTIHAEVGEEQANLTPVEGSEFSVSVWGVNGARGDADWEGDAERLRLDSTGTIRDVVISGDAFLFASKDVLSVSARSLTVSAGGHVGQVRVHHLETLFGASSGPIDVSGSADQIEVLGGLELLDVGGDLGNVRAGSLGPVSVGGNAASISVAGDHGAMVSVRGTLGTLHASGSIQGAVNVDGDLVQLKADGNVESAIHVGRDAGQIVAGDEANLSLEVGGNLGSLHLTAGGSANVTAGGAIGAISADAKAASLDIVAKSVGLIELQEGGNIIARVTGAADRIESGGPLTAVTYVGSLGELIARDSLVGEIHASAAVGQVRVGGPMRLTIAAAELAGVQADSTAALAVKVNRSGGLIARGNLTLEGTVHEDMSFVQAASDAVLKLRVGKHLDAVGIEGSVIGALFVGSADELVSGQDWRANVQVDGALRSLRAGGGLDATIRAGRIGGVLVAGSFSGEISSASEIAVVDIGSDLSGNLVAGGPIGSVQVGQHFTGLLRAAGALDRLVVGTDATGTLEVGAVRQYAEVGRDMSGTMRSGPVAVFKVGRELTGSLLIAGDAGSFVIGWDRTRNAPSGGSVRGATVLVEGDLHDLTVNSANDPARGELIATRLDVHGSAASISADGVIDATIHVGSDLGTLASGAAARVVLHVGGQLGQLVADGELTADISAARHIGTVQGAALSSVLVSAGEGVDRIVSTKGDLSATVRAVGRIETIQAGGSAVLDVVAAALDSVHIGFAEGGNLSGFIETAGRVGTVLVQDEIRRQETSVTRFNARLEPPPDEVRNTELLAPPVRPERPAPFPRGLAGNATLQIAAGDAVEALIVAGDARVDIKSEADVEAIWSGGDLTGTVVAAGGGKTHIDSWGRLDLDLRTGGSADIAAYDSLIIEAHASGEIAAGAWGPVSVQSLDAAGAKVWSYGDADVVAHTGQSLQVASLEGLTLVASGSGSLSAGAYGPMNATLLGQIATASLTALKGVTVNLQAPGSSAFVYGFGDVHADVREALTAEITAWGDFNGNVDATYDVYLTVLGQSTGNIEAGGRVEIETGGHSGKVRAGDAILLESHGAWSGDVFARNDVWGYVHGDLNGSVASQAGSIELDVSGLLNGKLNAAADILLQAGTMSGNVRAAGVADLVVHGPGEGQLSAGRLLNAELWGSFTGELDTGGTAYLTTHGDFTGTVHAAERVAAVAGGNFAGTVLARSQQPEPATGPDPADQPEAWLYVYGDLSGNVHADGDAVVTVLGDTSGAITAQGGRLQAKTAGAVTGVFVGQTGVEIRAGESINGTVQSGAGAIVEAMDAVSITADAISLSVTGSDTALTVSEADAVTVKALANATVTLTSPAATLTAEAGGALQLRGDIEERLKVYGGKSVTVDSTSLGDALISSWGPVTLQASADDVEVRSGGPVSLSGSSAGLRILSRGAVSGTWDSSSWVDVQAAGAVDATLSAGTDLTIRSAGEVTGGFRSEGAADIQALGSVDGTVRAGDGASLSSLSGGVNVDVQAGGNVRALASRAVQGKLVAGGQLVVEAGEYVAGDLRGTLGVRVVTPGLLHGAIDSGGDTRLEIGGNVLGPIYAAGDLYLSALGLRMGATAASGAIKARVGERWLGDIETGGTLELVSYRGLFGSVAARENILLVVGGRIEGDVAAGADLRIEAGDSVNGGLSAGGLLALHTLGDIDGNMEAGNSLYVESGGTVRGDVRADGPVRMRTIGGLVGQIRTSGDVEVDAVGTVRATVGGQDVTVTGLSDMELQVASKGTVTTSSYGPSLALHVADAREMHVWSLGETFVTGTVAGSIGVQAYGQLQLDAVAGGSVEVFSADNAVVEVEAGDRIVASGLGSLLVDLTAGSHVVEATGGRIAGTTRSTGDVVTLAWGGFNSHIVKATGDVIAQAGAAGVLDASSSSGDVAVIFYQGGSLLADAARRVSFASGAAGSLVVRKGASVDALADGDLAAVVHEAGTVSLQSTGDVHVVARQVSRLELLSEGDSSVRFGGESLDILAGGDSTVHLEEAGSVYELVSGGNLELLGSADHIGRTLSGGKLEVDLEVGTNCLTQTGSEGGVDWSVATAKEVGGGPVARCGVVNELLARGDIVGKVVASQAIQTVRAGARVLTELLAPHVGTIVSNDPVLANLQLPEVHVDISGLAARREEAEQAYSALVSGIDRLREEVERIRDDVATAASNAVLHVGAAQEELNLTLEQLAKQNQGALQEQLEAGGARLAASIDATEAAVAAWLDEWDTRLSASESMRKAAAERLARARTRAADFVAEQRTEARKEALAHSSGWQTLLDLRDSAAAQRPQRWLEEYYQAIDEVLADIQLASGWSSYIPGPAGMLAGSVHLGVSLVRGDWFAAGGDILSSLARATASRHGSLIGTGISAAFDLASYLTEDTESLRETGQAEDSPRFVGEPACFLAGTLIAVVPDEAAVASEVSRDEFTWPVLLVGAGLVLLHRDCFRRRKRSKPHLIQTA